MRNLSIGSLPASIAVYGVGRFGVYVRYVEGGTTVFLVRDEEEANDVLGLACPEDNTLVAHAEIVYIP